jgi:hypothetical protein
MRSRHNCTITQARKLRELGVVQGLANDHYNLFIIRGNPNVYLNGGPDLRPMQDSIDAFNSDELGAMLPNYIGSWRQQDNTYLVFDEDELFTNNKFKSKREAVAKADMLIHLLETDRVKIKSVNQRLNQWSQPEWDDELLCEKVKAA